MAPPGSGLGVDGHPPEADGAKSQPGHHRDVTSHCPKAEGGQQKLSQAAGEVERILPSGGEHALFHAEVDLASLTYILDGSGAADWKLGGSSRLGKGKKKTKKKPQKWGRLLLDYRND